MESSVKANFIETDTDKYVELFSENDSLPAIRFWLDQEGQIVALPETRCQYPPYKIIKDVKYISFDFYIKIAALAHSTVELNENESAKEFHDFLK